MSALTRKAEILPEPQTAAPAPIRLSDSAALMTIIANAARDPAVDVAKLERLLAMRAQLVEREAVALFDQAMATAQAAMRPVAADSDNPQTRSKYASYAALDRAVRPTYTQHGFSLSFNTEAAADPYVRVTCRVAHKDGHGRDYRIDMPADGKGAKGGDVMTKTHATGSAVSYGMRYLIKMIFNIAVGESDDDGNAATAAESEFISENEMTKIKQHIDATSLNIRLFCQAMKVDGIAKLRASQLPEVWRRFAERDRHLASRRRP